MEWSLKGRNALVCGSSRGIGKAAAIELAALGANVTLVSRSPEIMSDIVRQLPLEPGQDHDFLMADFTDSADLKKKISGLTAYKTIHILVNNTGGPPAGPITEAKVEGFEQAFHNHVICSHLLTLAVIKGMEQDGFGRIINIISTSVKEPIPGLGISNTIRGAMGNWAKTMANELGRLGITVNNVLPGYTNTGRLQELIQDQARKQGRSEDDVADQMRATVPVGRFAEAREIGAAVAFLASPAAAYINGINLPVDGGRTKSL